MTNKLPPLTVLDRLLICLPGEGRLIWKDRTPDLFVDGLQTKEHKCLAWNRKNGGKEAFRWKANGYYSGSLFGKKYKAHRIIWKFVYGEDPLTIDHINGNKLDNRVCNLRNVSQAENARNSSKSKSNSSGCVGVVFDKSRNKWAARIHDVDKMINLGRFDKFEDAVLTRKQAEKELGYHENHGREEPIK